MAHRFDARVYFEDTDAGGVVYHARYLAFAERARTEAMRARGIPHAAMLAEHNVMFVVRRVIMDYVRPARLDDSLAVETRVLALGGASARLRQDFFRDTEMLARADVSLACVRRDGLRPARIPALWRDGLASLKGAEG